jgi:hypothetical protein
LCIFNAAKLYTTILLNNGQCWEADKKAKKNKTKTQRNTICAGHHHTQTNTNNVNKKWAFLQITGGKDEPNIILMRNRNGHHNGHLCYIQAFLIMI